MRTIALSERTWQRLNAWASMQTSENLGYAIDQLLDIVGVDEFPRCPKEVIIRKGPKVTVTDRCTLIAGHEGSCQAPR